MSVHALLLLASLHLGAALHVGGGAPAAPRLGRARASVLREAPELRAPMEMRVKDLQEELTARGVAWRGVCFEKDELARALEAARRDQPAAAAAAAAATAAAVADPPAAAACPPADAAACAPADACAPATACAPSSTASAAANAAAAAAAAAACKPGGGSAVAPEAAEAAEAASTAESSSSYDAAYAAALARARSMKVKQLRTALHGRGLEWADLYEKSELAARFADFEARNQQPHL